MTNRIRPVGNSWNAGLFVHSLVDDSDLDPYEFRVYAHLCRRQNDEARVWEGQKKMAEACRMSRAQVQRALYSLQEKGWIRMEERYREGDGSRTTNDMFVMGPPPPASDSSTPCLSQRHPLPQSEAAKGNPLKEIQEKKKHTSPENLNLDDLTVPSAFPEREKSEKEEAPQRKVEPGRVELVDRLLSIWNEHRGSLPGATMTRDRRNRLKWVLEAFGEEAEGKWTGAVLEVAQDAYWRQQRYGLDNLLNGKKFVGKSEAYASRHPNAGAAQQTRAADPVPDDFDDLFS